MCLSVFTLAIVCCLAACGSDEEELNVTPTQITLLSDKGASSSFTITATDEWSVYCPADWLHVSATNGNGNVSITITALTENASSSERQTDIMVTSGNTSATITVTQNAAYEAGCSIDFKDIVVVYGSVAFHLSLGPKVDYFTYGWVKASAAGYTDDKIVDFLENSVDLKADTADELHGLDGLAAGQDYILVAIAYDKKGNRGELTRYEFTAPVVKNTSPIITVSDAQYTETDWMYKVTPNGYTNKFYMFVVDGLTAATAHAVYTQAEFALMIKDEIKAGEISPLPNAEKRWTTPRTKNAQELLVVTWGVDVDDKFSPVVYSYYGTISSKVVRRQPGKEKGTNHPVFTHSKKLDQPFFKINDVSEVK